MTRVSIDDGMIQSEAITMNELTDEVDDTSWHTGEAPRTSTPVIEFSDDDEEEGFEVSDDEEEDFEDGEFEEEEFDDEELDEDFEDLDDEEDLDDDLDDDDDDDDDFDDFGDDDY